MTLISHGRPDSGHFEHAHGYGFQFYWNIAYVLIRVLCVNYGFILLSRSIMTHETFFHSCLRFQFSVLNLLLPFASLATWRAKKRRRKTNPKISIAFNNLLTGMHLHSSIPVPFVVTHIGTPRLVSSCRTSTTRFCITYRIAIILRRGRVDRPGPSPGRWGNG